METEKVNKVFVTKIISKNIYNLRTDYNFTQEEFANITGIDQSRISRIESGEREIRIKELYLIVVNLKININWLFSLSDEKLNSKAFFKHKENLKMQV